MKRFFQNFRDDRFALTTPQNPNIEVRTYAPLVQAAQQEREWQAHAAQYAAPQPHATPAAPNSIPSVEFPVNVASTAPDHDPTALAPLDSAHPDSANPDSSNLDSTNSISSNEDPQQILDSLVADVVTAGSSAPSLSSADDELTAPPRQNPAAKPNPNHAANPSVAQACLPPMRRYPPTRTSCPPRPACQIGRRARKS